jgi:hypothetical protein
LTTRGKEEQSEWVCWMNEWCWWKGRTWKRMGCRAFQQGEGAGPCDGGGVVSPPHPGLLLVKRWSSTAACCSRWNMTASRSRSAKAKRSKSKEKFQRDNFYKSSGLTRQKLQLNMNNCKQ